MILARLLVPSAFGLMAIVGSTASVLHTITDIGVKEGLIQHSRGKRTITRRQPGGLPLADRFRCMSCFSAWPRWWPESIKTLN